jgi:3-oxoacyl-(acyl-carrier-protein) synthase
VPICKYEDGVSVDSVLTNSFGFGGNCSSLLFTR